MTEQIAPELFYNHVTQKYKTSFLLKHVVKPQCLTIIPELKLYDGIKILDVACGNGKLIYALANIFKDITLKGVDISQHKIDRNNKRNKFSQIQFIASPAESLPFDGDEFDLVTCTNAIHHFPQRVRAIDEMYRVLKPGGKVYILEGIYNKDWKQKFDKILRQTMFIRPQKKYLPRSAILSKSYLVVARK